MKGQILNHSEENNRLFGFLPSFLVYQNAETPSHEKAPEKSYEQIQEERRKRTESLRSKVVSDAETKAEKEDKEYDVLKLKIQKNVEDYNNGDYVDDDFETWSKKKKEENPYEEPIKLNFDNPNETITQIDRILHSVVWNKKTKTWENTISEAQYTQLLELRNMLTDSEDIYSADYNNAFLPKEWGNITIDENLFNEEWNRLIPAEYKMVRYQLPEEDAPSADKVNHYKALVVQMDQILERLPKNTSKAILERLNKIREKVLQKIMFLSYEISLKSDMPIGDKMNQYKALYAKMMQGLQNMPAGTNPETIKVLANAAEMARLQIKLFEAKKRQNAEPTYEQSQKDLLNSEIDLAKASGDRMSVQLQLIRKDEETLKEWQNQPAYSAMESAFDAATIMPILGKDEAFKKFWTAEGGFSESKLKECKELFFGILAEQTNGFKDELVLGQDFGNDQEVNKRNFPFIYNEWLKYNKLDDQAILPYKQNVENVEAEIAGMEAKMDVPGEVSVLNASNLKALAQEYSNKKLDSENGWGRQSDRWYAAKELLYNANQTLSKNIDNEDDFSKKDRSAFRDAQKQIELYLKRAESRYSYHLRLERQKGTEGKNLSAEMQFTRSNFLNSKHHQQILMEFAMRKFMKAMQMVDQPFNKGEWGMHYNSAVRRMLISGIYVTEVSENRINPVTGEVEFAENTNENHYWMLAKIVQSPYFDRLQKGKNMSPEHRNVLTVARVANDVAVELEYSLTAKNILELAIKEKNSAGAEKAQATEKLNAYPAELVKMARVSVEQGTAQRDLQDIEAIRIKYFNFLANTEKAINDPFNEANKKFIQSVLNGEVDLKISEAPGKAWYVLKDIDLKKIDTQTKNIERNYRTFEVEDMSTMDLFDRLGMNLEGVFASYLSAVKDKPELSVENWDNLFTPEKTSEFDELVALFERILPESDAGGKSDFIESFKALRGKGDISVLMDFPKSRDNQPGVIEVYSLLKKHIQEAQGVANEEHIKTEEIDEKLKGKHIGDTAEKYIKQVWRMVTSGSLAERGAGLIIMLGFLKMAHKAWKADDKYGKFFRVMFLAGAGEIALKKITGRGALDRAGLDSIRGSAEGTYEAVLLQQGEKYMQEQERPISMEEHAGALKELRNVPFRRVMEWHEKDESGKIPPPLPKGMNINNIVRGKVTWEKMSKEKRAQEIVRHTIRQFFQYVGKKDNVQIASGKDILKERWVTAVEKGKGYQTRFSDFTPSPEILDKFRDKPDTLTWDFVIHAEIDTADIEKTKGKTWPSQVVGFAEEKLASFATWTRQDVYGTLKPEAEELFITLGDKAGEFKEFIGELGEKGARNLYFAKESIKFEYGAHKYEIKRFFGQHWALLKEGVKLPFEIMYAADQAVIPFVTTKFKQVREILQRGNYHTMQEDMTSQYIGYTDGMDIRDEGNEKAFTQFGFYQRSFAKAFEAGNRAGGFNQEKAFYATKREVGSLEEPNIGYQITETTLEDINSTPNDGLSENDRLNKMQAKAGQDAIKFFKVKTGLPTAVIEDLMYPIHTVNKTSDPAKLYIFWRMPLKESSEYALKSNGRWADYPDPNDYKHRPPFMVDASKSFMENMENAWIKSMHPTVRVAYNTALGYGIQGPYLILGAIENIGKLVGGATGWFSRENGEWIKELTSMQEPLRIKFDERFAAATDKTSVRSDFYKKEENANMYKMILEYCTRYNHEFYLGVFSNESGHEGDHTYDKRPGDWNDAAFYEWYTTTRNKYPGRYPGVERWDAKLKAMANAQPTTNPAP